MKKCAILTLKTRLTDVVVYVVYVVTIAVL